MIPTELREFNQIEYNTIEEGWKVFCIDAEEIQQFKAKPSEYLKANRPLIITADVLTNGGFKATQLTDGYQLYKKTIEGSVFTYHLKKQAICLNNYELITVKHWHQLQNIIFDLTETMILL